MNNINKILFKFRIILYNIITFLIGLVLKRDERIILFGAWMGTKFADNSRYLFQYLSSISQEKQYKVIWATRNPLVYKKLEAMGYKTCLCGSATSLYWHLKAGFHIICNSTVRVGNFLPDIDTKFSWGAKKIQLWHGVGFKAVGKASNSEKKQKRKMLKKLPNILSEGGWNNCFVLCTSDYDVWINKTCMNRDDDNFFVSCYPRNCKCLLPTEEEISVTNRICSFHSTILYLPTFRSTYENYKHPLTDATFIEYLKQNNILWIEKPHTASNYDYTSLSETSNILFLKQEFDINTLYDKADLLVSDYSSSVLDGIYKKIPTIMYIPDVDIFKNGDIGFLMDIEQYFKDIIAYNIKDCIEYSKKVQKKEFFNSSRKDLYNKALFDFFSNKPSSYEKTWNDILKVSHQNGQGETAL